MTSPIERLPVEVFDIIALSLNLPAYQQLRLASRQLHLLSLSPFAKRHFAELTTTLGSPSLDRLVSVSKHGYLCERVRLLDIKLLTHRDYKLLKNIQKVGIYPPPKRFPVVPGIRQEHISGEATLYDDVLGRNYPQCIADRLARSLHCFPNLKVVRFRAHHDEPIGWKSIAMPDGDQVFREKCLQAVLEAIIKSEIQLEEFSMAKKKRTSTLKKCANLAYPALKLPFKSLASLQHAFANLQSLTMAIVSAHNGDSRIPGWENDMSHFIACAPNLKRLTLSLDRKGLVSHYSAAIIHSLALSCHLEQLETLHLINCALHEADLVKFLIAHAESLACIIVAHARLLTWNWETFWTSLQALKTLRRMRIARPGYVGSSAALGWRVTKHVKLVLDTEQSERSMYELLQDLVAVERGQHFLTPTEANDGAA